MTLQEFINQHIGQTNVGNTDINKGQCVGLVSVWMDNLAIPHEWGNAKDLLANADPQYFDIVLNDPNNTNQFPPPGAVMVLDETWGNGVGHTGVIVKADGNTYDMFEQNDVTAQDKNGACEVLHHDNYAGVIGWIIPKNLPNADTIAVKIVDFEGMRVKCDAYDPMSAAGYKSITDIDSKVTQLNKEVSDAKANTTEVEKELSTANLSAASLADELQKVKTDDSNVGTRNVTLSQELNGANSVIQAHYSHFNVGDEQSYQQAIKNIEKPIADQVKPLQQHAQELLNVLPTLEKKSTPKKDKTTLQKITDFFTNLFKS